MNPESLNLFVKAVPFQPFRITMVGGRTYDIGHPEMIRVGRRDVVVFIPDERNPELHDRMYLIGHSMIDHATPLDTPAPAQPQDLPA